MGTRTVQLLRPTVLGIGLNFANRLIVVVAARSSCFEPEPPRMRMPLKRPLAAIVNCTCAVPVSPRLLADCG